MSPAAAVHRASPDPHLRPERSGSSSSYLEVTAPGQRREGRAGLQPEESPTRSFLCGPLGFLSGCHLPKVMALWGPGPGRGRTSRKPPQQPCSSGCLKTLGLREAVTAEGRAQVTPRGLSRLRDSDSVRLPPASVYPFVAWGGGHPPRGTDFTPKEGNWAGSAQEGGREVAPNKSKVLLYSIFSMRPWKVWRSPFVLHAPSPALESVKTRQTGSPHCLVWQGGN